MKTLLLCSTLLAGAVSSSAAFAQESTTPGTVAAEGGLEEIIVTAQQRDENLQRAAMGGDILQAAVTASEDRGERVPSVVSGAGGGVASLTSIRGIGTLASNDLNEQVVAYNLAGVRLARPIASTCPSSASISRVPMRDGRIQLLIGRAYAC